MLQRILILFGLIGLVLVFYDLVVEFVETDALPPVAEHYVEHGPAEVGAANIVTAVVVTYRGLDTLGEVTVLFIAATGVGLMLKRRNQQPEISERRRPASELVRTGSLFLVSVILLLGIYIFVNGHLTPGGGFQGGAVIASGVLLLLLADPSQKLNHTALSVVESLSGVTYVGLGVLGIVFAGGFLDNSVLGLGMFGQLFSAGLIPLIYVCIGMKVGAELSNVLKNLQEA